MNRVLATILFTDIVGSSERAAQLGDKRWRQLLDRHDEVARAEVAGWHGRYVKSTGDGILATFDTPTRALRCAFGLADGSAAIGLKLRAVSTRARLSSRRTETCAASPCTLHRASWPRRATGG